MPRMKMTTTSSTTMRSTSPTNPRTEPETTTTTTTTTCTTTTTTSTTSRLTSHVGYAKDTVHEVNTLVPKRLRENLMLLRKLDEVDLLALKTLEGKETRDTRPARKRKLDQVFGRLTPQQRRVAMWVAETKEELAWESYELLDLGIDCVDRALAQWSKAGGGSNEILERGRGRGRGRPRGSRAGLAPRGERGTLTRGVGRPPNGSRPPKTSAVSQLNMAIDPHEPLYCVCNQVAFGSMVGCDNPECSVEWFHAPCVGYVAEDSNQGKTWLCPICRASDTTVASTPRASSTSPSRV